MHTNRLSKETSPYLQQHAHNPVDWYPWGDEALAKAKAENKPVLLSIGYSACHWCHVMEKESFENEAIAALMNEKFVNIKVDREERPDLDEIYMNAVQMLTGRGGWPMTVFLTPEGKPFFGGTYFPPDDRHGMPGFPKILNAVAEAYHNRKADVDQSVEQIHAAMNRLARVGESAKSFDPEIVVKSAEQLAQAYDPEHGGFGQAPKFPNAGVYELYLRAYRRSKQPRLLDMIEHTLRSMAGGGIYDHLGGGFHRYSVDAKWLVPHFEKMLYDNALLLRIYADAYTINPDPLYKKVVEETGCYLVREMLNPDGGFYSTQDADSEGEEGKFFVWTEDEVNRILGEEAGAIFSRMYDVTEFGNFEEKNILHPVLTAQQVAALFKKDAAEVERILADARKKLFAEREKRVKPFRDEKIIASWNGLALSGLAAAGKISGEPAFLDAARMTVGFVLREMRRDGMLLHVYKDGQAKLLGYLDDYADLAAGLLDLYEATLERVYLEDAGRLAASMVREFWDEEDGGFFYTGKSHEALISRTKPAFDGSVPSGNSVAAQVLLRLYYYEGNEDYLKKAEKVLRIYYDAMEQQPFGFAHMLAAFDFYLEKPKEVVLVGREEDAAMQDFLNAIDALYLPNKTLELLAPDAPPDKIPPLLQGKGQIGGRPTAYVCHDYTCSPPVTDAAKLRDLLEQA
ncbi:MAG TPA: thioredoxin domain-containing protein [Candidatus Binatia bacterium]|nr:thioredoxin domain-containing protein [Candidatus Binatia bacterium]